MSARPDRRRGQPVDARASRRLRRSRAVVAASSCCVVVSGDRRRCADDGRGRRRPRLAPPPRGRRMGRLALARRRPASPRRPALAIGFQQELKKRDVSDDDYLVSPGFAFRAQPHDGLRFYDQARGDGAKLEAGKTAVVHFTCRYRGIGVTRGSSGEARTLGEPRLDVRRSRSRWSSTR